MFKPSLLICCLLAGGALAADVAPTWAQAQAAPLAIVAQNQSRYSVVVAPDAPATVKTAAEELREYIEKATGAKLPVATGTATPQAPFISVGDTAAARAAGISTKGMPWESYRLVTRGPNVFILGPDTADGEKTKEGGTSAGTANGVYTFLEDYAGVRWLMPGEMGEDVPSSANLSVPANLDRTEAPVFQSRRVTHLQGTESAREWERRQKLGYSLLSVHNHNWIGVITPDLYQTHPEWFPEIDGKRIPPVHTRYKIETTNPELVKYFAEQIKKAFRADPDLYMFSMSPEDGSSDLLASWSMSQETEALLEKDPNGRVSHTKLVLKFYNEIARIVAQEFPDRKVAGYVYSTYLYPPAAGVPELEPNLFLTIAMSPSYGYAGYRPQVQKVWAELIKEWSSQTANITYYDLPTWLRWNGANLTPPAPELMNTMFPMLRDAKIKGTYIYGTEEWSQGAVTNYTLARLTWNPSRDAYAVNREFYERAYGSAAAPYMEQIYQKLDAAVKKHYIADNRANFNATPAYMKNVVAASYPEVERLYLAAQAAAQNATTGQKARLNFFGDNLILTNYRLRKLKAIPDDATSPLYRSEAQVKAMAGKVAPGFGVKLGAGYDPDEDETNRPRSVKDGLIDKSFNFNNKRNATSDTLGAKGAINTESY